VFGNVLTITTDDIARILKCNNHGEELESLEIGEDDKQRIEYYLYEPGLPKNRSNHLRPQPRLLLRMLIKTIFPRQGSHEVIYDHEDKALLAIFGGIPINWAQYIYDEFYAYHNNKKRSLIYGPYIARILAEFKISSPFLDFEQIKVSNTRFFSLMKVPEIAPKIPTYEQYKARELEKGKSLAETSGANEGDVERDEEQQEEDEDDEMEEGDDEAYEQTFIQEPIDNDSDIELISGTSRTYTKSEKLKSDITLSKNQRKLSRQISSINTRFDKLESKVDKNSQQMKNITSILRRMWKNSTGSSPPSSPTWGD